MRNERLRLQQLSGMLEVYVQPAGVADLVVDMRLDRQGAWSETPGYAAVTKLSRTDAAADPFAADSIAAVETIFWWSQHNGARQWLVWEEYDGTTLDLVAFSPRAAGQRLTIASDREFNPGPWPRTQYLANAGWMYFINGFDKPSRWNGERIEPIGFDRLPTAPIVSGPSEDFTETDLYPAHVELYVGPVDDFYSRDARGVGDFDDTQDTNWLYGYAVTWVNELGMESPPSPIRFVNGVNSASTPLVVTDGPKFIMVRVPTAPDHVRAMRLWRTDNIFGVDGNSGRGAKLFLLDSFETAMGLTYIDGRNDRELGLELDESQTGLYPTGAKFFAMFKGVLFISGMPEYPDRVQFSTAGFIEQFPSGNFFQVGDRDAGELTGLHATKNALIVFKRRGIYLIKGDPVSGFFAETLTEDVGSASPNALKEVPGQGLLFISEEGPMLLEGALENTGTPTSVREIGAAIQRTWRRRVDTGNLVSAQAEVYHRERELWIQVPALGNARPTLGLVYHYDLGTWSIREGWPINCMVESRDHRALLFFGSHGLPGTINPGVHVVSQGWGDRGGAAITGRYVTGWITFGSEAERVLLQTVEVLGLSYGDRTATMSWSRDRRETRESQTEVRNLEDPERKDSVSGNTRAPKWARETWSTSELYTDYNPTMLAFPVAQTEAAFSHQFELAFTGKARFISMDFTVASRNRGEGIRVIDGTYTAEVR